MKRRIIKTISLCVAIILTLLTLFSCNPPTNAEQENGGNNTNVGSTGTSHYIGVNTLYSYEDVMDALAIVRQRCKVEPTYTVKDMGEEYTIFYQFLKPHYNRPYPIDYDVYFTSESNGLFYTVIFFENQTCSSEDHLPKHSGDNLDAYKEDEDYEKLRQYMRNKACITINVDRDCSASEIGNLMSLSYSRDPYNNEQYGYSICLRGKEIMYLESCIELDDAFFEVLFENIVTTRVKK